MRELLGDPYYGNITPNEQDIRPGSPLQKAMEQAEECEETLNRFAGGKRKGPAAAAAQRGE